MSAEQRVNILLVDDQPGKLLSYEVMLADLNENLIKTNSAREALEQLLRNEIAVVLIDVVMPDLDGFELAAMIREHPRFRRTSIIFVSAINMSEPDLLRGYEAGGVDYVTVPVVPQLLRAKVRVFADLYRKTRQLEQLNAELERRVEERTAELAHTNADLERRVEERTREREAALAQVHQMQKLESLGQLTGGVAHDFNNLLMVILGNLNLLRNRLPDQPRMLRLIDGAVQGAERGAALTKRMLAFARRQDLKPETIEVGKLLDGMEELLRRTLGPGIDIVTDYRPGLPPVRVDPSQMELAVLNLALNARDAMPHGGRLLIGGRSAAMGIDAPQELEPGDYVCLSVTDDGSGMDDKTLARAAEPFFTTKGVGKGTGLGLSMVHGFAAQSGGAIRILSRLREGTTVEVWLPIAQESATAEASSITPLFGESVAPSRILVVDDDPLVAASTAAMLEDLGHVAIEALSGQRALDMLSIGARPDLVILDHAMPGMTGTELARLIKQSWPGLPVILASGYAELPQGEELELPRLAKPYVQAELAMEIAKVLGERQPLNVISLESVRRA
jgi:signal transduction histidine kinase